MAKQSGIHQIKGKVGQMSYYRQKGVETGLVRGINQGLSARVKNDDAYANTRLNNEEFKTANSLALGAFNAVPNRKRGMMLNFALARMTKRALEAVKLGEGVWGRRTPTTELDKLYADMLEHYAKGGAYDGQYGDVANVDLDNEGEAVFDLRISVQKQQELNALGIDALQFITGWGLVGCNTIGEEVKVFAGTSLEVHQPVQISGASDITTPFERYLITPSSVGMSGSGYAFATEDEYHGFFAVVTVLPLRTINGQRHVLQEYATYFTIPLGQIPEE